MEIPGDFLKTTFYLCVEEPDDKGVQQRIPKATGFFVSEFLPTDPPARVDYFVTSRHCVEEARPLGKLYIRFNRTAPGVYELPTHVDDWKVHASADVACVLILPSTQPEPIRSQEVDQGSLSQNTFVGPGPLYEWEGYVDYLGHDLKVQPSVGHEVFFTGLFSEHPGQPDRNLPVARFGHISRMPSLVDVEAHGTRSKLMAYLVELHSRGGHSGSPVFFLHPMMVGTEVETAAGSSVSYDYVHISGLLGMVSGHYPLGLSGGRLEEMANSGIAIVTPAYAIRELLMREDLKAKRHELAGKIMGA